MAKQFFQRYIPDSEKIKKLPGIRYIAHWLTDPNLWHLTRHSTAKGTFIGIVTAMIPFLLQPLYCILLCIWFRANILVAMFFVLITNPLTAVPVFYFAYKLGALIMGVPIEQMSSFSFDWIWSHYKPLFLGSMIIGLTLGAAGYGLVRAFWRRHTIRRWHKRRLEREKKQQDLDL